MNGRDEDLLIEAAVSAWRPRAPDGRILPHPAWADLSPEDRERVYEDTLVARGIEQGLDAQGLSTTARCVLGRISGAS